MRVTLKAVLAAAALTSSAMAQTVTVDGVGATPGTTYATLEAALKGIAGTNGTADVINITVDALSEPNGVAINGTAAAINGWPTITDSVTINGNADADATRCVVNLGADTTVVGAGSPARFAVKINAAQSVTINDLVIIPTFVAADTNINEGAIIVDEAATAAINGAQVTINNVLFTASQAGNVPMDPNAAAPAATGTFWNDPNNATCIGLLSTPAGSTFTFNVTNVVCAHNHDDPFFIYSDGGTVNVSNCRFTRTISAGTGDGIGVSGASGTTVNIDHTVCDLNDEHGLTIGGAAATLLLDSTINVGPGCQFINNNFYGIRHSGDAAAVGRTVLTIAGTPAEPVVLAGSDNRGYYSTSGGARLVSATDMICMNNASFGWEFNEIDMQAAPSFTHCLFANSGGLAVTPALFRVGDTNAVGTPGSIEFTECTFYNVSSETSGDSDLPIPAIFQMDYSGTNDVTVTFTDCILAGSGTEDAVNLSNGAGKVVNFVNSALVLAGFERIASVNSEGVGTVNQTAVTNANPVFVDTATKPLTADSFDVDNPVYAGLGSGASDLSGWGDFIGSFVQLAAENWQQYR